MKFTYHCPRIRLTKAHNKGRAIIPIDAISGIEEDKSEKCTRVCTFDGFWYEVSNSIEEIDSKISEVEQSFSDGTENPSTSTHGSKIRKVSRKVPQTAVDKPARRVDELSVSVHPNQERNEKCE